MKKFQVTRQYATIADVRRGRKMSAPQNLGVFTAVNGFTAVRDASKLTNIDGLFLTCKEVKE